MPNNTFIEILTILKAYLPEIINEKNMGETETCDDYTLVSFHVEQEYSIEEFMNILEDKAEMSILYHHTMSDEIQEFQRVCAYPPRQEYMYKINAKTNEKGYVEWVTLTMFHSLEVMINYLREEFNHLKKDFGFNKIPKGYSEFLIEYS